MAQRETLLKQTTKPREALPAQTVRPREPLPNGRAAAAMLAAGIGCLAFGLLTVLGEVFKFLSDALRFYPPAGQVTGATALTVAVWLVSWLVLFRQWKNKQVKFTKIFVITLMLIILGIVGTFPPFFELFAR